ncbi:MAG: FeoB-associated Cys-rich membrane protein [Sphaerochaetaceae bacterium]
MANILIGLVVFGGLGAIVWKMVRDRRKGVGSCHSGCGTCPFACEKRHD